MRSVLSGCAWQVQKRMRGEVQGAQPAAPGSVRGGVVCERWSGGRAGGEGGGGGEMER